MHIRVPRGWELPERAETPERLFRERRAFAAALAAGPILAAAVPPWRAADAAGTDPSGHLYPVARNTAIPIDRDITPASFVTTFNNFYEYGSSKDIWREASRMPIRPWEVRVDGLVEREFTIAIDDLLARMPLEERIYRHRCVEGWSMTVPWSGFPMRAFLDLARPLSAAKYVAMESFLDLGLMPLSMRLRSYPWPYVEGLAVDEAANELAFLVTGAYGKPLQPQNGSPLRLAVPWKYGFKSTKSIVRFTFTEERPLNFWQEVDGGEYGFWANVNPQVAHPRWTQASERVLGGDRVPTLLYNGYGEYVAGLYDGRKSEPLFV